MSDLINVKFRNKGLFSKVTKLQIKIMNIKYDEEGNNIYSDSEEMDEEEEDIFEGIFNQELIDYETWEAEVHSDNNSVDNSDEEKQKNKKSTKEQLIKDDIMKHLNVDFEEPQMDEEGENEQDERRQSIWDQGGGLAQELLDSNIHEDSISNSQDEDHYNKQQQAYHQ